VRRATVLVVDDDAVFRVALERYLEHEGYAVLSAGDSDSAIHAIETRTIDLLLTDLRMPGTDGIELIRRTRNHDPEAVCIVITGFGTPERSIEALQAGAFWFIDKDYEQIGAFGSLIEKALEHRRLRTRNQQLQQQLRVRYGFENIVGQSEGLRSALELVRKVADTDATVLVLGESGVGKELVARAIHYNSARADQPFIAINCGAIPEELLESELFGHVRGAFTSADRDRMGRFTAANGGTLFLDEIGDMSAKLQTKLLRVLQEQEFERVGSSKTERVDVRIIAATNQDLHELMRERRFREDLYFRLSVIPIDVPPLRERREDVPRLVEHFLSVQRREYPDLKGITEPALKHLLEYDWPGNVRELEGLIERLAVLKRSGWITDDDLPPELRGRPLDVRRVRLPEAGVDFAALIDTVETDLILQALDTTGWNKNQAARLLGLKRTTLVEKIRSKGLQKP
jgi:DNA-binding NtrC family response regulator